MTLERKQRFFTKYKDILGTETIEETFDKWKSLTQEKRKELTNQLISEKMKDWHKANKEEFKDKMKGHKVSDSTKRKIRFGLKDYYSLESNRKELSERLKKKYSENPKTKEQIEKQSSSLKRTLKEHPEIKSKISESMKQWHKDNPGVTSARTKIAMKEFYETEKGQENLKKWTNGSRAKGTSSSEKELQEFVKSLDPNVLFNDRSLLDGKELDIVSLSHKIAVEFNGDIWHSEAFKKEKAAMCHLEKTLLCEQLGVRLIHVFSDEWDTKKDIVKSIISAAFGKFERKYMARKLTLKKVSLADSRKFLNENHIQGFTNAGNYLGLYDGDELVQIATFGKNRFKKVKNCELIRMATKLNCQVVGGFSKITKNFMKDNSISYIESYVDRRLFDHKGYSSSGWTVIGASSPRYFYTDGKIRENRQKYMKQSCLRKWPECTLDMTEHQMCLAHGLYRIYDCGTIIVGLSQKNN